MTDTDLRAALERLEDWVNSYAQDYVPNDVFHQTGGFNVMEQARAALAAPAEAAPDLRAARLRKFLGEIGAREALINAGLKPALDFALEADDELALAAPAADGLDVERLAKAIRSVRHDYVLLGLPPVIQEDDAEHLAAAYLREPSREPGEVYVGSAVSDDLGIPRLRNDRHAMTDRPTGPATADFLVGYRDYHNGFVAGAAAERARIFAALPEALWEARGNMDWEYRPGEDQIRDGHGTGDLDQRRAAALIAAIEKEIG